jgi:hypothetical protein
MVNENESTIADETGPTEPESPVKSPAEVLGLSAAELDRETRMAQWMDMPLDVWQTAILAAIDVGFSEHSYVTKAIARAILTERERCAKVCINFRYEHKIVGERYAAAIRSGENPMGKLEGGW